MRRTNSAKNDNRRKKQELEKELKQLLATEMKKKPEEIDWDKIEKLANKFERISPCKYAYQVLFFVGAHKGRTEVEKLINYAHNILISDRTDIPSLMFLLKQSPEGVSQEIIMYAINKLSVKLANKPNDMIKRCLVLLFQKNDPDISKEELDRKIQGIINTGKSKKTTQERPYCLSKLIGEVNAALKSTSSMKIPYDIIEQFKQQHPNLASCPEVERLEGEVIDHFTLGPK